VAQGRETVGFLGYPPSSRWTLHAVLGRVDGPALLAPRTWILYAQSCIPADTKRVKSSMVR
jgi:hypothetical protein